MPKLFGAQRLVLQAILDLATDSVNNVTDVQISGGTKIALDDLRNWLEILEGEGYVDIARTTVGFSASITAKGKLALRQYAPVSSETSGSASNQAQATAPSTPVSASGPTSHLSAGQTQTDEAVPTRPIRLFYSYSHEDESLRNELAKHLAMLKRQGVIAEWHDRRIGAGEEWKGAIDKNLDDADVILLLVSAWFLASDYCWDVEMTRALERHDRGEATVIPVILRRCDWHKAPFSKLQGLPRDCKAITSWQIWDEAFTDVALGIRQVVEAMTANPR
jgi:TIR domain